MRARINKQPNRYEKKMLQDNNNNKIKPNKIKLFSFQAWKENIFHIKQKSIRINVNFRIEN